MPALTYGWIYLELPNECGLIDVTVSTLGHILISGRIKASIFDSLNYYVIFYLLDQLMLLFGTQDSNFCTFILKKIKFEKRAAKNKNFFCKILAFST